MLSERQTFCETKCKLSSFLGQLKLYLAATLWHFIHANKLFAEQFEPLEAHIQILVMIIILGSVASVVSLEDGFTSPRKVKRWWTLSFESCCLLLKLLAKLDMIADEMLGWKSKRLRDEDESCHSAYKYRRWVLHFRTLAPDRPRLPSFGDVYFANTNVYLYYSLGRSFDEMLMRKRGNEIRRIIHWLMARETRKFSKKLNSWEFYHAKWRIFPQHSRGAPKLP